MRTRKILSVTLPEETLRPVRNLVRIEDRIVIETVREAIRRYDTLNAGLPAVRFIHPQELTVERPPDEK